LDTFDLNWPRTDATLYTDGWRCRIVWRERRGGMGGTIDNNEQCKRRVADSLDGVPNLLGALRARGHGLLASEIAALADGEVASVATGSQGADAPAAPADASAVRADGPAKQADGAAQRSKAPTARPAERIRAWVGTLAGDAEWETADSRRASQWAPCLEVGDEALLLKAPAPKGKQEWVLKRTWPKSKRKPDYVVAPSLRGIGEYLLSCGAFADTEAVERFLAAAEALGHADLATATGMWHAAEATRH